MTIDEGIQSLARLAEKCAYISYKDFNDTFSDDLFSADQLDNICVKLKIMGIEIIDQPN